jgi:hypothetical protein
MAERVGFEPTVEFPLHSLSRRALSTAQTPLRADSGSLSITNAAGAHNFALCALVMGRDPVLRTGAGVMTFAQFLAREIVPRKIVMEALGISNVVSAAAVIFKRDGGPSGSAVPLLMSGCH